MGIWLVFPPYNYFLSFETLKTNFENTYDYYELGFDEMITMSAQSGRQVGILLDKIDEMDFDADLQSDLDDNCISLAIVGMPNVGKSSLMNEIVQQDVSIIDKKAGTTRDVITATTNINGLQVTFYDTAGLQESKDRIEKKGIQINLRTSSRLRPDMS